MVKHKAINTKGVLFLAAAAVVLIISIFTALRGKERWISEAYGTTNDAVLPIGQDEEIVTSFKITNNNFAGVYIKFVTEIKSYEKERVGFRLVENETGHILAQNEVDLKTLLNQIDVFIDLPVENSKNKNVSLYITGEEIYTVPFLYVSKNRNLKSSLRINDEESEEYLVFSAVYLDKSPVNFSSLLKGGIYLLLLGLIFFWNRVSKNAEENRYPLKEKKSNRRIQYSIVLFFLFSLFFWIAVYFVHANYIVKLTGSKKTDTIVKENETPIYVSLCNEDDEYESDVKISENNLSSLTYRVEADCGNPKASLHVQVTDEFENLCYLDRIYLVKDLPSQVGEWILVLDKEYKYSKDRRIKVLMEPSLFENTEVRFIGGNITEKVKAYVNGRKVQTAPVLSVSFQDNDFLHIQYLVFVCILYLAFILFFLLICIFRISIKKACIPLILIMGLIYLFIIPIYSVPDEYTHIDTAYILSNRILGIPKPQDMVGYDYKREEDIETDEYLTYDTTLDDYRRIYTGLLRKSDKNDLSLCVMRSGLANANALYYAPAAVGITLGRLLRLGTLPMLALGRLFNLITYCILVFLAIRKLPGLKALFLSYCLLPICLQQAASYSYDCVFMGISLVFLAYCLYWAMENAFSVRDSIVLLFCLVQLSAVKGGVYLPVCILMFLIPLERRWKWKKVLPFILATGFCLALAFMQNNFEFVLNNYLFPSKVTVSPFGGQELFSLKSLLQDPFQGLSVFLNTAFTEGSRLVYEFFGGKLGSLSNIQMPWIYIMTFSLLLLAIYHRSDDFILLKANASKILVFLAGFFSFLLVAISMLLADTPQTSHIIIGIQGRYYLPFAFSIFLLLPVFQRMPQQEGNARGYERAFLAYGFVQILFALHIIMVLFPVY